MSPQKTTSRLRGFPAQRSMTCVLIGNTANLTSVSIRICITLLSKEDVGERRNAQQCVWYEAARGGWSLNLVKLDVLWGSEIPRSWNHILKVYSIRSGKQRTMGVHQYAQSEKQKSFGCVRDMSCQNRPKQYTVKNRILTHMKGTN